VLRDDRAAWLTSAIDAPKTHPSPAFGELFACARLANGDAVILTNGSNGSSGSKIPV
jgi:hypothetical protein